jgi:hypothetical protein
VTSERKPTKRTASGGAKRAKAAAETPTREGKGVRTAGKLALSKETVRNLRAKTGVRGGKYLMLAYTMAATCNCGPVT